MTSGFVSLVGAGPGDPELLTLKALRRLQAAEVVIYDDLINPALLDHCRRDARLIYAGKRSGHHTLQQDEINALLVGYACAGYTLVRLKGGDPFVFGRGAEEAEALVAAGVAWEVVPGVSSVIGVPAYAGIPLTHRALASSFAVITGHEDPEREETRLRWQALAQGIDTLVILMGVERLQTIAEQLIAHGRVPSTPAALVRWGATPRQQTLIGTLGSIAGQVTALGLTSPAVIVVGAVVECAYALDWFDPSQMDSPERPVALDLVRKELSVVNGALH